MASALTAIANIIFICGIVYLVWYCVRRMRIRRLQQLRMQAAHNRQSQQPQPVIVQAHLAPGQNAPPGSLPMAMPAGGPAGYPIPPMAAYPNNHGSPAPYGAGGMSHAAPNSGPPSGYPPAPSGPTFDEQIRAIETANTQEELSTALSSMVATFSSNPGLAHPIARTRILECGKATRERIPECWTGDVPHLYGELLRVASPPTAV